MKQQLSMQTPFANMNDLIDWNKLAKPDNQQLNGVKQSANDITQPRLPPFSEILTFISINDEEIATQNTIQYNEHNTQKIK